MIGVCPIPVPTIFTTALPTRAPGGSRGFGRQQVTAFAIVSAANIGFVGDAKA